jgi:hypothetical protein
MENENSIPFGIGSVGKLPGYHHWLNPDDPEAEKKGFYKDLYNFMRKRGYHISLIFYKFLTNRFKSKNAFYNVFQIHRILF